MHKRKGKRVLIALVCLFPETINPDLRNVDLKRRRPQGVIISPPGLVLIQVNPAYLDP